MSQYIIPFFFLLEFWTSWYQQNIGRWRSKYHFISDKGWVGECYIGGMHNKSASAEPRIRRTQPSATGSTEPLQPFLSPKRDMDLITKVTTAWPKADRNMYCLQACQFQNTVKRKGLSYSCLVFLPSSSITQVMPPPRGVVQDIRSTWGNKNLSSWKPNEWKPHIIGFYFTKKPETKEVSLTLQESRS